MEDKKKKIVLASLLVGIPAVAGITIGIVALTRQRKETPSTLQSIQIVSDIKPINIEQGQSITTDPIQVKCYDQCKKEMEYSTKLVLLDMDNNPLSVSWITINTSNQIVISNEAVKGVYSFKLQAISIDQKVVSEAKIININIYDKPTPPEPTKPNKITIEGVNNFELFNNSTATIKLTLKAWIDDKEYSGSLGQIFWDFKIQSSSLPQQTPPEIEKSISGKEVTITITSNSEKGPIGNYSLSASAYLVDLPELIATKNVNVSVVDGMTFKDNHGYIYKRSTITDDWELTSVPEKTQIIDQIREEVMGYPVSSIATGFADNSNICSTLSKIVLPSNIKYIKSKAFNYCSSLAIVSMSGVEEIEDSAFNYCSIMQISTPLTDLKTIGNSAFYKCEALDSIDIRNATIIGSNAFYSSGLKTLSLSEKISTMYASSFANIKSLTSITINAITPPISEGALFTNCSSLSSIFVPAESVELYKNAEYWSEHKTIIKSIV